MSTTIRLPADLKARVAAAAAAEIVEDRMVGKAARRPTARKFAR
jgi:hypothetical protein